MNSQIDLIFKLAYHQWHNPIVCSMQDLWPRIVVYNLIQYLWATGVAAYVDLTLLKLFSSSVTSSIQREYCSRRLYREYEPQIIACMFISSSRRLWPQARHSVRPLILVITIESQYTSIVPFSDWL
jgi:hypothetical protein